LRPTSSDVLRPSRFRHGGEAGPYRSLVADASVAADSVESVDAERVHPALLVVWAASLARVAGAAHDVLRAGEPFSADATLALMTVVAITWYAIAVLGARRRHG
jgi:hypothetical protein